MESYNEIYKPLTNEITNTYKTHFRIKLIKKDFAIQKLQRFVFILMIQINV